MPRVAFLIAASPTGAFYSQLAVVGLAVQKLTWSRWKPSLHVYLGGSHDVEAYARWRPYLRDFEFSWVSDTRFAREGDWAQSDDVFRLAPGDADVLVTIDADTLPVAHLEPLLDRISEFQCIAGVIAHYPTIAAWPPDEGTSSDLAAQVGPTRVVPIREVWERLAEGFVDEPLDFTFSHTLVRADSPPEHRLTPFYLNFGVVFFGKAAFDAVAGRYIGIRPDLMERLADPVFSGQAALTLAAAAVGARTWSLPMRYNFPNDPVAETMYPDELANVAVFHYLRTRKYDRHRIFTNAEAYTNFLSLPLVGVDLSFQRAVKQIVGFEYPFI